MEIVAGMYVLHDILYICLNIYLVNSYVVNYLQHGLKLYHKCNSNVQFVKVLTFAVYANRPFIT